MITFGSTTIFHRLRHRRAKLAQERCINRQGLVRALEHDYTFLPCKQSRDNVCRKWPEHREVEHSDLESPSLTKEIGDSLGICNYGALPRDHPVSIVDAISARASIVTPAQISELAHRAIGKRRNVIKVEGALRGNALSVAVLILHHAKHCRMIHIEHLGNATAFRTECETLCGCR